MGSCQEGRVDPGTYQITWYHWEGSAKYLGAYFGSSLNLPGYDGRGGIISALISDLTTTRDRARDELGLLTTAQPCPEMDKKGLVLIPNASERGRRLC
ncbi:hypothetical protein Pmani_004433 [Petrolisthes manimaculis]|uniref:Uncharacterized protein n=1 Tax=Petrolisthes manimaculis TaxID=1843537 RepID=A0AAE1QDQ6_9EUCA|nr:hypothetical protein Pmani_004433 [Petrolisthes manimaculis]